jgi:hypothetical protein
MDRIPYSEGLRHCSVGRRTVQRSKPMPHPKSTRMSRSGLPRVFVGALACTSMQTFGGRCSCTSSVRSTQTASSQQHSPQYSPRVRRPSNRRCCSGTATGRHGHQTTPCRKPWRARVCRSTSRPAHPIAGLPPILSLNLDMSACLWRVETTVWNFSMSANSEYLIKDPTLFDGLGPCFGLVQITGSILLRYVLNLLLNLRIRILNGAI